MLTPHTNIDGSFMDVICYDLIITRAYDAEYSD